MKKKIIAAVFITVSLAMLATAQADNMYVNMLVNGDFEDTTGWGAAGTTNFPVGWGDVCPVTKVNGAAQQSAPNAIGGNTSAFMSKSSYGKNPEWGLSQNIPDGVCGEWQFDMDFASKMPSLNYRSFNFYLSHNVITNINNPPGIALSLWNLDGTGLGDIRAVGGTTSYTILDDAVIFDNDVQVTPLVHHLRICGHYDLANPTWDIILTDSNGTVHSAMGLTYYYLTAPVTGAGIKDIEVLLNRNNGDHVFDNISLMQVPEPGTWTLLVLLGLSMIGVRRLRRD